MIGRKCVWVLGLGVVLSACASSTKDAGPTLRVLNKGHVDIERNTVVDGGIDKAIASYRAYLDSVGGDPARASAMHRLADLELKQTEAQYLQSTTRSEQAPREPSLPAARGLTPADYRKAIELYQDLLAAYPSYAGNDQVLYQLARAYEQSGDRGQALALLDRLVSTYPNARYIDEAQFRRGELLFVMRSYSAAEQAYAAALQRGERSPFWEKSLYKQGWSQFKQARYEDALDAFFKVLDRRHTDAASGQLLPEPPNPTRGEQELIEDTYRVVSLSFAYLGGEREITRYVQQKGARPYAHNVYAHLGALYIKQERYVDAANAYNEFARHHGNDRQAPLLQLKAMEAYQQGGFPTLLLQAKADFVVRYGARSHFWTAHGEETRAAIAPRLKTNIEELARHYHAQAQKSRSDADYREAARWYSEFVLAFARDTRAPEMNFLWAEALFEGKRYGDAAFQYEQTAYAYPSHPRSAEAGYAALLAHQKHARGLKPGEQPASQRRAIASALRFAESFPGDPRMPAVLTKAAEELFALKELDQAARAARQVTALAPAAPPALQRTAWTVVAHVDFEKGAYAQAEKAYQALLRLTPTQEPKRTQLYERLAASVYKQGEQQRAAGDERAAVAHFLRVRQLAPNSSITATAEYDAAAGLLSLREWQAATTVLERFAKQYPNHRLQGEVPKKLALGYVESGQWSQAATQFERMAASSANPRTRQEALWQAAELYDKGGAKSAAIAVYTRYVRSFPQPFERALEARYRIAELYGAPAQWGQRRRWLMDVVTSAESHPSHTERTRYLAASAAFLLAEPLYEEFRRVSLVAPLKRTLKKKKQKMQAALKAYGRAANYKVAQFTTAATFRIAAIYHDLSRDLLASERPKGLSKLELEQYTVLLEEEAYPFEEKAIEIYETNVQRVGEGIYDQWVRKSFAALGKLRPARYAKSEKGEKVSSAIH